jgi:saccharopine dehydrogenase (NADP+, L-glutamate forming)
MKTILILGAGRSSAALITYLLQQASVHGWSIVVGDVSEAAARQRIGSSTRGQAVTFDIQHDESSKTVIQSADVVISLVPPNLHPLVAKLCLALNKHLITASYVSPEMQVLHDEAKRKDLLF